jgi:hypothetical protein
MSSEARERRCAGARHERTALFFARSLDNQMHPLYTFLRRSCSKTPGLKASELGNGSRQWRS